MNIDRFNEPGSEQSARHAKSRRDCRSNREYQLRKREATRDFRKYILDNYTELAWNRGIYRMSNDDRDRMRAFMSPENTKSVGEQRTYAIVIGSQLLILLLSL